MNSSLLLGVNIDHAATLRQARYRNETRTHGSPIEPDPVAIALLCEHAGADCITVHLREDRRHAQEEDVIRLRAQLRTRLNLEMACTEAMLAFALKVRPHSCCLVPEGRNEITTEGGLDIVSQKSRVREIISALHSANITTSLFIDPDLPSIETARELSSPWIELHTGAYAHAYHSEKRPTEFARLRTAAMHAHSLGLTVNAGHGINYINISEVRTLPFLHELNIGHSIISRALVTGIEAATREMKTLMNPPTP